MAGILANSASQTMVAGDTSADNVVSEYVRLEKVTLTTSPTGTNYLWTLTSPDGSTLSDSDGESPSFVPTVAGTYVVNVDVDGTTYAIRIGVLSAATSTPATDCVSFQPMADAQVAAPALGSKIYWSSTQGGLSQKLAAGTVQPLATEAYVDTAIGGGSAEYGEMYMVTPAATTLTEDVWAKAAGTTALGLANDFTMPANNRLQHSDSTELYYVQCEFSVTSAGNNQICLVGISKDGANPEAKLIQQRTIGTGTDYGMGSVGGLVQMGAGDYVELWVQNTSSSATITINRMNLRAVKVV